ncbi:uncharacterized protein CANTADRAFT_24994 [Suhomyces tanzawaensis NRRL Y-17324]|uniref:Uncharacterized protein n=1 Tax=Suhomyces tanzawaensis NRRL Y-17324 TaxID=984487 RepID=A0A1E4SLP9_9ASCO|nr:uncharacterized protein CANTADRAFT_24994 [Suhomyces tanzawaensis NRRL Y-17324]ODV80454.1 hypothetical protein CANTADRAFT_24994 [Suhomyces tanzawaensis NRRL Y-17324]
MSRNTPKLASNALNLLSKVIDSDTEVSTIDLNLLENLNTNQSLNYIKLEQKLNVLEKNSQSLEKLDAEYKSYTEALDAIELKVQKMEKIAGEMDAWSKSLESRAKNQQR